MPRTPAYLLQSKLKGGEHHKNADSGIFVMLPPPLCFVDAPPVQPPQHCSEIALGM